MTGEPCPVIVTRLVLNKATREIVAIRYAALMQLCEDGRTELEPMGDYYRFSNEVFYGTEPIEGCDDWLIISDFPVELSRHTRMKSPSGAGSAVNV